MKGRSLLTRLGFALAGLRVACSREASVRFHVLASFGVLTVLLYTRPEPVWWALGGIAVGLVVVAELANTALEALADRLHPERHPEIGVAKDVAAAAVLVASIVAVLVAVAFVFR